MGFKAKILDVVVCPVTKSSLKYDEEGQRLISISAELAFPIRNNIPILSVQYAEPLSQEEIKQWF